VQIIKFSCNFDFGSGFNDFVDPYCAKMLDSNPFESIRIHSPGLLLRNLRSHNLLLIILTTATIITQNKKILQYVRDENPGGESSMIFFSNYSYNPSASLSRLIWAPSWASSYPAYKIFSGSSSLSGVKVFLASSSFFLN
jgi:hypothetical protein